MEKSILTKYGINPESDFSELEFTVVDTETCGIWKASRIVEIAAVKIVNGQIKNPYSRLINPEISIPPQTTAIHGIDNEKVKNAKTFGEIFPEFLKYAENSILVAHNSEYDEGILSSNSVRYGLKIPPLVFLDTLELARNILPQMPSYSLGELARNLDINHGKLHRASEDAAVTAILFQKLMKQAKLEGLNTIYELFKRSNLRYLGQSASVVKKYPQNLPFLSIAVLTKADLEFHYFKDDKIILIPGTIICTFNFGEHSYIEIRDHETEQIRTLRFDRIKHITPLY